MLESKQGQLSLFVERTSLVGDAAVCISFSCKASACCILKLKNNCGCGCFPVHSEEACVCYALYLAVRQALCGDPLATSKSKVGDVHCGLNDGEFSISWRVKPTGSAVRKSLGIALKCLAPSKVFSAYSHCIKVANGKPNREHFSHAASVVNAGIKAGVSCGVIGNIRTHKIDPTSKKEVQALVLTDMLSILRKKLPHDVVDGKKSENKEHTNCDHSHHSEVKVAGVDAVVLKDYVQYKIKGITPSICGNTLLIPMKSSTWESASKRLKAASKDYVAAKYSKLKDQLGAILGYMMFAEGSAGVYSVHKIIKDRITAGDVEKMLSKHL